MDRSWSSQKDRPEETGALSPSGEAGSPSDNALDFPDKVFRTIARAPERQSARAPERQSARARHLRHDCALGAGALLPATAV